MSAHSIFGVVLVLFSNCVIFVFLIGKARKVTDTGQWTSEYMLQKLSTFISAKFWNNGEEDTK